MCDQQSLRSACAYAQSDQSLCLSLEYSMTVRQLTEHHLELLNLKGGCTGSSESTKNVKLLEITCHGSIIYLLMKALVIWHVFSLNDHEHRESIWIIGNKMFGWATIKTHMLPDLV